MGLGKEVLAVWVNVNPAKAERDTVRRYALKDEENRPLHDPERPPLVVFNLGRGWEKEEGALRALDLVFLEA